MKRCLVDLIINNIAIIKVATNKSFMQYDQSFLCKRFCNLWIRLIVLFILHSTVSRCFSKNNRVSRMIPRCFWDVVCITLLLLNTSVGCDIALDFRLKMTSCACFIESELKLIFHWNVHLFIFVKSLFSSRSEVLLSWITENKDVSSTNSLAFEDNPSNKSLIYIKKNNGPSVTSDQSQACPFSKTLCFLFLRKSHKRFSKLPDISFCFNLKIRLHVKPCQTPLIYLEKHLWLQIHHQMNYIFYE